MNNNHQPLSDRPKKIEEITQDDIKYAAITYAAQFGLHAQKSDCQVTPISNKQRIAEIGGNTDIKLLITKWIVTIPRKNTSSKGGIVLALWTLNQHNKFLQINKSKTQQGGR